MSQRKLIKLNYNYEAPLALHTWRCTAKEGYILLDLDNKCIIQWSLFAKQWCQMGFCVVTVSQRNDNFTKSEVGVVFECPYLNIFEMSATAIRSYLPFRKGVSNQEGRL